MLTEQERIDAGYDLLARQQEEREDREESALITAHLFLRYALASVEKGVMPDAAMLKTAIKILDKVV